MLEFDEFLNEPVCPECEGREFKEYRWYHPMILHWLLNPGLLVNELFMGQRIPRRMMLCKGCKSSFMVRGYTRCGGCGAMLNGQIWTGGAKAFGHWLGYACPQCEGKIPAYWNLWSLLLLAATLPVWILPFCLLRRKMWAWEVSRAKQYAQEYRQKQDVAKTSQAAPKQVKVLRVGLAFGIALGVALVIPSVLSYLRGKSEPPFWPTGLMLIGMRFSLALLGGLAFGLIMKRLSHPKNENQQVSEQENGD